MVIWQLASVKCDNSWNLMHGVMLLYFSWISFYWATVAICYQTVVCPVSSVCLFVTLVYCWTDPDETWRSGRPRPWPHCVKWGPSSPSPNGGGAPNFRPISVVAKWLDGSRCHLVGGKPEPKRHCVRWGTSCTHKRGTVPNFRPMSIAAKRSPISATAEHLFFLSYMTVICQTRSPAIAEGPRDAGVPVEIW